MKLTVKPGRWDMAYGDTETYEVEITEMQPAFTGAAKQYRVTLPNGEEIIIYRVTMRGRGRTLRPSTTGTTVRWGVWGEHAKFDTRRQAIRTMIAKRKEAQ